MFNWIKNLLGEKKKPLVFNNPVKAEEVKKAEVIEKPVELVNDTVTKPKAPAAKKAVAPKAPAKKAAVTEKPAVATKRRGRPAKKAD